MSEARLYVFVHGVAVVEQKGNGSIKLFVPEIEGHVYKAGNWLAETSIAPNADIVLEGTADGTHPLNSKLNSDLLLHAPGATIEPQKTVKRAATFTLPSRPDDILYLVKSQNSNSNYLVRRQGAKLTALASLLVFKYVCPDEARVQLQGHHWEPCSTDGSISLHIIAQSDMAMGAEHQSMVEASLQRMVQGYPQYQIYPGAITPANWMDAANQGLNLPLDRYIASGGRVFERTPAGTNGPFAFSLAELQNQLQRMTRFQMMGMYTRLGLGSTPLEQFWTAADPLIDYTSNCVSTDVP
jgi:hypothetical protein